MKTLKPFTKWFTRTGSEDNTQNLDYSPSKDFIKSIREREAAEKVRREKWSKEFKKQMNTTKYNSNYTYSTGVGQLSGSSITSNTITTAADAKVRIDGSENGSMQVDVPLIINGRDVMKELDEMRDALLLLKRDVDMEAKYPRLRELKDQYEAALAKYKTFDTLKESR
jgi:RNA recognition motif-containing protein